MNNIVIIIIIIVHTTSNYIVLIDGMFTTFHIVTLHILSFIAIINTNSYLFYNNFKHISLFHFLKIFNDSLYRPI